MNRKYTCQEFKNSINLLKKAYQNVLLTTDIIVGFPGETDEEFLKTYEFLKEVNFYKMHIFKYSKRKGTKAAIMESQIDGNIKELRSKKLISLSNENEQKHNETYIGKTIEVLFEERENDFIKGHTTNYIMVKVKTNKKLENQIINVKILENKGNYLIGIV